MGNIRTRALEEFTTHKAQRFYEENSSESRSALNYEFGKDEYLEEIMKKFGFDFESKQ